MEKTMIGLLLMFIVAVAAFNIVSTLVMVVTDKTADIAILRTMGATPGRIMRIFIIQGAVIGVFGTLVGTTLGVLGALNISGIIAWLESAMGHQFLSADVYPSAICHRSCSGRMCLLSAVPACHEPAGNDLPGLACIAGRTGGGFAL